MARGGGSWRRALLGAVLVVGGCAGRPTATSPAKAIAVDSFLVSGCGGGAGTPNRIGSAFTLDHARDIWQVFPKLTKAPELEIDAPAVVVVMPDPVIIPTTGHGDGRAGNALCVKIDGVPNIYTDVDLATPAGT